MEQLCLLASSMPCSAPLLTVYGHCPELVPPTLINNQENAPADMPIGQSDGAVPLLRFPLPAMSRLVSSWQKV